MIWFYELNGQQHGPVSDVALDQLLIQGRVRPTTRVWKEGMADWEPLSKVRPSEPEPPQIDAPTPPPLPPNWEADERSGPPWENQQQIGFIPALTHTVAGALFRPYEFFSEMRRKGGNAAPLLFLLLTGTLGSIAGFLLFIQQPLPVHLRPEVAMVFKYIRTPQGIQVVCLSVPFILALFTFVNSAVLHILLQIFARTRQPFETTFRVICYAFGATRLLSFIPLIGMTVAFFWNITVTSIGLSRTHQINPLLATLLTGVGLLCSAVVLFMMAVVLTALIMGPPQNV